MNVFGLPLAEDRRLQRQIWIDCRYRRLFLGFRPQRRVTCARRLDTCAASAPTSAAANGIEPRQHLTRVHGLALVHVDRAHDRGPSACSTSVGASGHHAPPRRDHAIDRDQAHSRRIAASMLAMTHRMPRADRGTCAEVIAVDGIWNSRMIGSVDPAGPRRRC